jgi:hypothetical protein
MLILHNFEGGNMLKGHQGLLLFLFVLTSCSIFKDTPKYQLSDGEYSFKQTGGRYQKAFVTNPH